MLSERLIDDGRVEVARARLRPKSVIGLDTGHCDLALVYFWRERDNARGSYIELLAAPYDLDDPYECIGGES